MGAILRLMQCLPLVVTLVVLACLIYLVVAYTQSPNRAKEVLIKVFTALNGTLSIALGLVCLYCLAEGNQGMLEFFGMFLAVAVAALLITRICRAVFVHRHPNYEFKRVHAHIKRGAKKEKSGTYNEWE